MAEYSKNISLKVIKILLQILLIGMLCYQGHLSMRDTDKLTFTNRVEQSLHFLYKNDPGYRLYIFNEFGIDRKNCTANQTENMI